MEKSMMAVFEMLVMFSFLISVLVTWTYSICKMLSFYALIINTFFLMYVCFTKRQKTNIQKPKHAIYKGGPGRTRYHEGKAMVTARVEYCQLK